MEKSKLNADSRIWKLVLALAIPAVISALVSAIYNFTDQVFISRGVGLLANAAASVCFPIVSLSTAIGNTVGVGSAANFNINLGMKNTNKAENYVYRGMFLSIVLGLAASILVYIFADKLVYIFGGTDKIFQMAFDYLRITSFGLVFLIFTISMTTVIRADGRGTSAMMCVLIGAVINIILDPIFIFILRWGIKGAAWATVIGQIISAIMTFIYLQKMELIDFKLQNFKATLDGAPSIIILGSGALATQVALMVSQITLNQAVSLYGSTSIYGSEIPLAVVGVAAKLNVLFMAFITGLSQGSQPLMSYSFGSLNYKRLKDIYLFTLKMELMVGLIFFVIFQVFTENILLIFNSDNEKFLEFGKYFIRIYMFMTIGNGVSSISSFLFTSITKPKFGVLIASMRQIILFVPLLLLLSNTLGLKGIPFVGPISDFITIILSIYLVRISTKDFKDGEIFN